MPPSPPRTPTRPQHVSESTAIPSAVRPPAPSTKSQADASTPNPLHRRLHLIVAACVLFISLLAAILGGSVTAIVAIIIGACTLQGLWRGATKVVSILVGMFVAALLCQPIGRAFEGVAASVAGTTGLTNRFLSIAIAAVVIAAIVSSAASFAIKRFWTSRQNAWMKWDHLVGGGVGFVEGAVLSLVVLWTPIMLEPIASAQVSLQTVDATAEPSVAQRVAEWASAIRASPLGGLASATSPASSSPLLQLLEDFIAVSRDPEAMAHFLNSEPIQRLKNLPSVSDAIHRLESDPDLRELIVGPAGDDPNAPSPPITGHTIRAILDSNTLLQTLDHTTIVQDLTPLTPDIAIALREAKDVAARRGGVVPGPSIPRGPGGG